MIRLTLRTLAVACGLLASVGSTRADDPAQKLGRYRADDDKKAAATSPLPDDTEQIHHRGYGYGGGYGRSYYGGYGRSYYGGYYGGYRPNYYGGFGGGFYGGGLSFGYSSYYAPRYYVAPSYYYAPTYAYPSYYYGGYWGISGTTGSGATLTLSLKPGATAAAPAVIPANPPADAGQFRYDGGPANPVPQPKPDGQAAPKAAPAAEPDVLKIAVKPKAESKPVNRYKAYGEK
ncbi:hypothetical protein [Limnoglobus roseus]|uniref:TIGR03000 domain-containing protein n=1 Tax=Limnoglobus roseus TaxID=2598579 RepID=A0A5C1A3V2_9BACT|nr:hypothetical protein [Limnoglobus roseus]QEL13771.1 hypothetical protein PX52LOC_00629 [Limnoglobus roseus]